MRYTPTGQLCGYICPEVEEPLAIMTVRFYRPDPDSRGTVARVTARPKETFTILEDGDVEAKEDRLLAETETDDEGELEIDLGEEEGNDGEALEIDVRTDHVPGEQHDDAETLTNPNFTTPVMFPADQVNQPSIPCPLHDPVVCGDYR